jgi:DNA repair photolyase
MPETRTAEDPTKAVLSESGLNKKALCDYVINVATGCRHGCRFCYVPSTPNIRTRPEMLNDEADVEDPQREWGDYVLYRDDLPERLDAHLDRKRTWTETDGGQGIVGVSFHTDCFMDERAAEITAGVIETLAGHGRYCRILTRNPMLATQYLDTFQEAGEYVTIGSSIPTLNEAHMDALEPDAPPIQSRLRGLERFAEAGVNTYVSMSPTYPGMNVRDIEALLERISAVDPDVVFHEPINPRGGNYQMTVAAAEEAGCDGLARQLVNVQGPDAWLRYAVSHFRAVQRLGDELGLPIYLWPDAQLVEQAEGRFERYLQHWRDRQSPEGFAGRPTPSTPPMDIGAIRKTPSQQSALGEFAADGGESR